MIGLARFLTRAFARVEPRHWAGVGASAALHLAVVLGWQPSPPPEPEAISFEVSFEPVTPLPAQKIKAVAKKAPVKKLAKTSKTRKLASKTQPKRPREAHLLDADWKAEHKPAKDVPELALPDAQTLGIQSDKLQAVQTGASQPLKPSASAAASAPAQIAASNPSGSSGAEWVEPQVASIGGAKTAATQTDGGLALANTTTLSSNQRVGSATAGAQANNTLSTLSGGSAAGDAAGRSELGRAVPTQTAHQAGNQGGSGMPATSGAEATSMPAATLAAEAAAGGAQAPGVRLAVSGVLTNSPALPAGAAVSLAAPQAAALAQAALQSGGTGAAPMVASGGAATGQAARPGAQAVSAGRGDAAQASPGDTRASRGVRSPESGGRLSAGAAAPARSSAGAGVIAQPGRSGQHDATLGLAPGDPGSSPGLAVTLQPLIANAPANDGAAGRVGRSNVAVPVGAGRESLVASARSGMTDGGGKRLAANASERAFSAAAAGGDSHSAGMPVGTGRSGGGLGVAPANNAAAAVLAAAGGSGRPPVVLHATQPPAVKVVRPDSEIQRLDVLAPSNYCPLPLPGHTQPDNRAPQAERIIAEQPAYAPENPGINYPVLANIRGVEGRVTVRVEVLSDGRPGKMWLKQSSGSGILDQDAQAQLKQWRFVPARRNGQPVSAWIDVPVMYRLSQARP